MPRLVFKRWDNPTFTRNASIKSKACGSSSQSTGRLFEGLPAAFHKSVRLTSSPFRLIFESLFAGHVRISENLFDHLRGNVSPMLADCGQHIMSDPPLERLSLGFARLEN